MSRLSEAFLIYSAVLLLSGVAGAKDGVASSHPPDAEKIASEAIAAHAARVHGTEYADHREWGVGDLNGDGRVDYVVLYTIEDGNNYSTYMAALLQGSKDLRASPVVKVGGRGKRFVHLDSITDGRMCPSGKGA